MMDNKVLVVFFILLMLLGLGVADTITNYQVDPSVPLNQNVTATGIFTGDINAGVLCSFYFFDASTGVLVNRATDQYTTTTGRFTMPYFPINEPTFRRDSNYTLTAECGATSIDANFFVEQREGIGELGEQEFKFLLEEENIATAGIWFVMLVILAVICSGGYLLLKKRSKK